MTDHVVVIGAGYAGAGTVKSFEDEIEDGEAELTWISEHDYHLVLHETHRVIRNPQAESKVAIPVDEIKSPATNFIRDRVTGVDTDERTIDLRDGESVEYDYLLVALGSGTAFFGIDGLEEHALTMKSLDDAREIHEAIREAGEDATQSDPAQVLVGGAGLSGIQTAGEIAGYRDDTRTPMDIKLVEGLDEIFPGNDPRVQGALKKRLQERDVEILTGDFISEVDEETVYLGEDESMPYDVLVWTGGITGREEIADTNLDKDDRSNRVYSESDFQTSDDRVFAIGDAALVDQGGDEEAPPTAQAAWQAAEVAGENLARAVRGAPLKSWKHKDKGTVISVGEDAVAHDVMGVPINTFGGLPAKALKKGIACRWIADVTSVKRAVNAWSDM
ncbi:NAD(P)/FAD-dependent oxidoreductase [Halonotius terrestris]|uniref:NAD(P)/FAD-dependent oxidoreductase n=1 Tax=Halonotius terrestris TaxID=2487750 RepID=A0A8J8P820_9EURY|nr:NAD(P)/FAD-dependent oxidoreductase [Halonotius terrestris]TQQ79290.1 NAD(P)/FAD-dependent oxidoreductase [Halonotius terrestris]